MKPGLEIGATAELIWTVDPSLTITLGLGASRTATVFSTPSMIMLMERSAREVLRPFLEEGEESVGAEVRVEHLTGATLGAEVRGVATVTRVEPRAVHFDIHTFQGERLLGRGQHRRAVVSIERLLNQLEKSSTTERERLRKSEADRDPLPKKEAGPGMAAAPARTASFRSADGPVGTLRPTAQTLESGVNGGPTAFNTLRVDVRGAVVTITLNRPRIRNAVNTEMTGELERLVAWLSASEQSLRVGILTGAGAAFCSGDDVSELETLTADQARAISLRQARLFLAFEGLPQPLIAAVNGFATGAGCVCANACDFRIASHAAQFGMPEIKLGWTPGYGLSQLTALIGKARALDLCLTGRAITANTALEWGLVNEVVPGNLLMPTALALAETLLAMPPQALRRTKRALHADEGHLPKVTHFMDTEAYIRDFQTADAREGIQAFLKKRPPKFKGE